MLQLQDHARLLQSYAWANSTRATINSEQKIFLEFASKYNVTHLPVHGDILVTYCTWLVLTGRLSCAGSVKQYLSAVSTLHKMFGFSCDTPKSYGPLNYTVQGIKRRMAAPARRMKPITPAILHNLLHFPTIPPTDPWSVHAFFTTIKSLYIILFLSMLRSSNLIPASPGLVDHRRQLTWGKITKFQDRGVVFTVTLSKTIQFAERVHEVALAAAPGSALCPVAALGRLLDLRGGVACGPDQLVFQVPDGAGGWKPLTKAVAGKVLGSQIASMGLDPAYYRFHAFRHGSLNEAVAAEPSLELIRVQSDHLSDAIHAYTALPGSRRFGVSKKILDSVVDQWSAISH